MAKKHEPTFEGDRKIIGMRELIRNAEDDDVYDSYPPLTRASDYAPPDVRNAVADIEEEIGKIAQQQAIPALLQRSRDIGNSVDMQRAQTVLNNTITAAHEDTCKALDKVVGDARDLLDRITKSVDNHKKMLQDEGQKIAVALEAAIHELTNTVKWVETQSPKLRDPKLESIELKEDAAPKE